MTIAPARLASTVVLLRPSASRFDVFLVKRHDRMTFMGGAHVFPGGRVDDADRGDASDDICDGAAGAIGAMNGVDPSTAIGHHVAAIRELFEEAGVLLARRHNGRIVDFHEPEEAARFRAYRHELATGTRSMRDVARREHLRLALDALVYFAHWVTPEIEARRFDTRFFLSAVPAGQEPVHDDEETIDSVWIDPADAVEQCRRDAIALPPPTWTTLRTLSRFGNIDELTEWARRRPVVRVQPWFVTSEDVTMLTLPGDPLFPPIDGFETPAETRFVLDNGRWRAVTT
jgi:8-oxo-dGTP pyrophosphatase MutT (NUDIX family)